MVRIYGVDRSLLGPIEPYWRFWLGGRASAWKSVGGHDMYTRACACVCVEHITETVVWAYCGPGQLTAESQGCPQ